MPLRLLASASACIFFSTFAFGQTPPTESLTLDAAFARALSANPTIAAARYRHAIDVANASDEIVVTNGTYAAGGRALSGTMTNRVSITNSIYVHSMNGAGVTFIQGRQLAGAVGILG